MAIVFNSIETNYKIKITDEIETLMSSYKHTNCSDTEAGGILAFREDIITNNKVVEFTTVPYKHDIRRRNYFCRQDKMHIIKFNDFYNKHNGIYGYLGEWHTHYEKNPHFSQTDRGNWQKIARKDIDPNREYYHIIIGTETIAIWGFNDSKNMLIKVYEGEIKCYE